MKNSSFFTNLRIKADNSRTSSLFKKAIKYSKIKRVEDGTIISRDEQIPNIFDEYLVSQFWTFQVMGTSKFLDSLKEDSISSIIIQNWLVLKTTKIYYFFRFFSLELTVLE